MRIAQKAIFKKEIVTLTLEEIDFVAYNRLISYV